VSSVTLVASIQLPNATTGEADDDTFTSSAHGLLAGTGVYFATLSGGAGLSVNTQYYVVSPTANTFQLSATIGGSAIDVTSDVTDCVPVVVRYRKSGSFSQVYHNTVYHAGFGDADISTGFKYGIQVINNTIALAQPWPVRVSIKNNIVYDWNTGESSIPSSSVANVTYANNFNTNPSFLDTTISNAASLTQPTLRLPSDSGAVNAATYLTQANGSGSGSTTLVVDDALYVQDGSWGSSLSAVVGDTIAVGTLGNTAQVSAVDYQTNTITLATALTWSDDASIWVVKDSWGVTRVVSTAPDHGAYEYGIGTATAPTIVVVR
jgi:hypothetical protein